MAGRKKKPCEWCEQEILIQTNGAAKNVQGNVEIYPDVGALAVYFFGIDDDGAQTHEESIHIPLNYCPNCGRKLGF